MTKILFLDRELSLVFCRSFRSEVDICNVLLKVKFTLLQATKAQRGSRGMALLFL